MRRAESSDDPDPGQSYADPLVHDPPPPVRVDTRPIVMLVWTMAPEGLRSQAIASALAPVRHTMTWSRSLAVSHGPGHETRRPRVRPQAGSSAAVCGRADACSIADPTAGGRTGAAAFRPGPRAG